MTSPKARTNNPEEEVVEVPEPLLFNISFPPVNGVEALGDHVIGGAAAPDLPIIGPARHRIDRPTEIGQ